MDCPSLLNSQTRNYRQAAVTVLRKASPQQTNVGVSKVCEEAKNEVPCARILCALTTPVNLQVIWMKLLCFGFIPSIPSFHTDSPPPPSHKASLSQKMNVDNMLLIVRTCPVMLLLLGERWGEGTNNSDQHLCPSWLATWRCSYAGARLAAQVNPLEVSINPGSH